MLAFLLLATAVCGSLLIILMRAIPLCRTHSIGTHIPTHKRTTKAHVRTPSPRRCRC